MKRIPKSVWKKKYETLWNGFWNPFHTFLKQITYSVCGKKFKICETEFVIRFRKVWNGFQNPFHSKIRFIKQRHGNLWNGFRNPFHTFLKRITNSISQILNFFFQKRNTWSISEKYETDSKIRFIKFHFFFKRILKSISLFLGTYPEIRFIELKGKKCKTNINISTIQIKL